MKTFAIALIASASAIQIRQRFAAGVTDEDILNNRLAANATFAENNATYGNATFGNATYANATFGNASYSNASFVQNASFGNASSNSTFGNATFGNSSLAAASVLPFCDAETGVPGVNCQPRQGNQPIYLNAHDQY